ncbi:unnamed protein product [Victoria cruziana]
MVKQPPWSTPLVLLLLVYLSCEVGVEGSGFRCVTDGSCKALVGYRPGKATTMEEIIALFQIASFADLLEQNSLPRTTPKTLVVPTTRTVRVPITCRCEQGTGNCDGISPFYVVKQGDTLDYIANSVFAHLVDVRSLALVGHVTDPNRIDPGAVLWIPLPCSCDRVDGAQVTHYALVVQKNDTLKSIAAGYNTTVDRLEKLNNLNATSLAAGQVLDVPLPLQVSNLEIANGTSGSSATAGAGKRSSWLKTVLPVTLFVVVDAVIGCYCFWRSKTRSSAATKKCDSEPASLGRAIDENDHELSIFQLEVIMAATDSFSEENKLGQGGYGPVYKGMLAGEHEVAVKRLSLHSKQGYEEFMNEVKLISKLQHKNLVQLLGCCFEGEEKILVYEYMPNRSLDKFLFDPTLSHQLVWEQRLEIILGIARGLQYLHQESRLKLIHRDLKTSNILLDGDLRPKISDFGVARAFSSDQTQVNTRRVVGTYGYMPPEYAMKGRYSTKSDVFSFGVIILEIVSGKKMASFHDVEHSLNLSGHVGMEAME